MNTKHTPGPWLLTSDGLTVYALNEQGENRMRLRGEGGYVWRSYDRTATASRSDRTPSDELKANARLIAAAPDLLAALQMMVRSHDDEDDTRLPHLQFARKVLASAGGTS